MNQTNSNRIKKLLESCSLASNNPKQEPEIVLDCDFSNETILITGAAGTIGSGLSKLLLKSKFKALILIDNAETPLYYLQKELERYPLSNVYIVLADIRDELSIKDIFEEFIPSLMFHTAAYKHVTMMESNPYEAVKLNILATGYLADLAMKHKIKKFVFISTDKAVDPISVMGMTKHICERYLDHLNTKNKTRFLMTRFGNILESNGSLIPLFRKQMDQGIPLTITDPEVTRYFITKAKACQLILNIADKNNWKHNMFTFNMGEPIKILDLAHSLLKLNKLDIQDHIKIVGLRPGEKLHEDIISDTEKLKPTQYNDVLYVVSKTNKTLTKSNLNPLKAITPYDKASTIKAILKIFI